MSRYNQQQQSVHQQFNIVVQGPHGTQRKSLRNIETDYKWTLMGSRATVHFTLDNDHTITYKRDEPNTVMLYCDGKLLYRRSILNPFARIDFQFQVDAVDCQFLCQCFVLGIDVRLRIGGHEVLSVLSDHSLGFVLVIAITSGAAVDDAGGVWPGCRTTPPAAWSAAPSCTATATRRRWSA